MVTKLKYMTGFILGGILAACVSCTPEVDIYNRQNETCNFPKRNEQNFSFFAFFFLLIFRPLKYQLNAD